MLDPHTRVGEAKLIQSVVERITTVG